MQGEGAELILKEWPLSEHDPHNKILGTLHIKGLTELFVSSHALVSYLPLPRVLSVDCGDIPNGRGTTKVKSNPWQSSFGLMMNNETE